MIKRLLLLPLILGVISPVLGEVNPSIHKKCLQAKDYLGCVKAMSGEELKRNQVSKNGNTCPTGYAYIGQGYCREVICRNWGSGLTNNPLVAGKKWRCQRMGAGKLNLDLGDSIKIGNNTKCPTGEPKIGWNSTCDKPYKEPPKKDRSYGKVILNLVL
ncbi:hypothetical protein [Prochlorococcus marinus]|uniref:hypothetical protein n=1 Tax=Prochlorococcus marinus TaxID=1219 RepID=UPI0022B42624|nr:hypothetical protein [Prochlorococcus marinus]